MQTLGDILNAAINRLHPHQRYNSVVNSTIDRDSINQAIERTAVGGNLIPAIKLYRHFYDVGLREAKQGVEHMVVEHHRAKAMLMVREAINIVRNHVAHDRSDEATSQIIRDWLPTYNE